MSFFSKKSAAMLPGQISQFSTVNGAPPAGHEKVSGVAQGGAAFQQGRAHLFPYRAEDSGVSVADVAGLPVLACANFIVCPGWTRVNKSTRLLDLGTGMFQTTTPFALSANHQPSAFIASGCRVYCFATRDVVGNGSPSFSTRCFNLETSAFETRATIDVSRRRSHYVGVGLPGGNVLIAGGQAGGTGSSGTPVAFADVYDAAANEWLLLDDAPFAAANTSSFAVALSPTAALFCTNLGYFVCDLSAEPGAQWFAVDTPPLSAAGTSAAGVLPDERPVVFSNAGRAWALSLEAPSGAQWQQLNYAHGDGAFLAAQSRTTVHGASAAQTASGLIAGWNTTSGFFALFDTSEEQLANLYETFYARKT